MSEGSVAGLGKRKLIEDGGNTSSHIDRLTDRLLGFRHQNCAVTGAQANYRV